MSHYLSTNIWLNKSMIGESQMHSFENNWPEGFHAAIPKLVITSPCYVNTLQLVTPRCLTQRSYMLGPCACKAVHEN